MGTIDANGVFQYDNTDHVVPLATFMNLGQQSVSDAMEDLRTDVTVPDTGWVNLTLNTGWSVGIDGTPRIRKIGNTVWLSGHATHPSAGANPVIVVAIPAQFRPSQMVEAIGYAGGGLFYRGTVSSVGQVVANNWAGVNFRFSIFSWAI